MVQSVENGWTISMLDQYSDGFCGLATLLERVNCLNFKVNFQKIFLFYKMVKSPFSLIITHLIRPQVANQQKKYSDGF